MSRSDVLLPIPDRTAFDNLVGACDDRPMRPQSEGEPGQDLEAQARSLHLEFDYPGAMRAYEHAYAAYRREGDLLAAARAARTLGWFHGSVYGDWAVYRGWVGRAVSLLEQAGVDSNEHGWVLLAQAQAGGGLDVQKRLYEDAIATARRCQDGDLECEALAALGIMLAFSGHVADGMARLDEALAAICAGEVDDLSVVEGVFCGLFNACERTNDVGRAEQWLRVADDYVRRRGFAAVGGYCRAYYGGILTSAGRWAEAELELTSALTVFPRIHEQIRGTVLCRLANLRLHQGRLEEAAELLVGLDQHEDAIRPLAVLYLLRGEPEVARDLLERTLEGGGIEDAAEGTLLGAARRRTARRGRGVVRPRDGPSHGLARAAAVGTVPPRAGCAGGAASSVWPRGREILDRASTTRCGTSRRPDSRSTPPAPSWSWQARWYRAARLRPSRKPLPRSSRSSACTRTATPSPRQHCSVPSVWARGPGRAATRPSPDGRPRCSSWSAEVSATPRSGSACSSARRPSSTTWAGSWPSSASPAGPEPSPMRPPSQDPR